MGDVISGAVNFLTGSSNQDPYAAQAAQEAEEARKREKKRQRRITEGTTRIDDIFAAFDDPYYQNYATQYVDLYTPEVMKQHEDARRAMTFDLGRRGILNSSEAARQLADLTRQHELAMGDVRTRADQASGELRDLIGSQRQTALDQLYATEDPDVAANTALQSQQRYIGAAPTLTGIGSFFEIPAQALAGYNTGSQRQRVRQAFNAPDPFSGSGRVIS